MKVKNITFIHAADLHLGGMFSGFRHLPDPLFEKLITSSYKALKHLVQTAIKEKVDFVLLAGDIYDVDQRSLKAQIQFQKAMEELNKEEIPVYLIHGNHDFLEGKYFNLSLPSNVYVFGQEVEVEEYKKDDGTTVMLYGFSYGKRHVRDRMIDGYIKQAAGDFHIGLLHGNLEGETAHGNYAPFTKKDLLGKGFDYWALGHIHKRMFVLDNPAAVYPGCLQGRNKKETGEKGFYLVELSDVGTKMEFRPASVLDWQEERVVASGLEMSELVRRLNERKENLRAEGKDLLLEITLDASDAKEEDWLYSDLDEVLEAVQEGEETEDPMVWIHSIKVLPPACLEEDKQVSESFLAELLDVSSNIRIEQYEDFTAPLFIHPTARRYLQGWNQEARQEIILEANMELMKRLNRK